MASDSGGLSGLSGPSASERERQYCELCGKMENLLRCGRCRSSFYCSKEHQRRDWKKHKLVCQSGEAGPKGVPGAGERPGQRRGRAETAPIPRPRPPPGTPPEAPAEAAATPRRPRPGARRARSALC